MGVCCEGDSGASCSSLPHFLFSADLSLSSSNPTPPTRTASTLLSRFLATAAR